MTNEQWRTLVRIAASALLLAAAVLVKATGVARLLIFLIPYLIIGWDILWRALRNIARGQVFDENFLMALATVGAFAIGEYPEGVLVMLFYQVGELFQDYAVDKSRRSIAALMDIRPDIANVERDGALIEVDPEVVEIDEVIVVKPGERLPLDGVVLSGHSALDARALTGESMPRDVAPGDEVLSGCINQTGTLRVRVTKAFSESTVSKILELVENAGGRKARAERFITRFARIYTPAVVICAVLLALVPPLLMGGGFREWLHRALIFLVISCPCALVLSVPLTFFGGIGGASRAGILIKGASTTELLAKVETVVFDKTGTLTKGVFRVSETYPVGMDAARLIELAALAECYSDHPIAESLRAAYAMPIDRTRVEPASEEAGRGVRATVDGQDVRVGNGRLMAELGIAYPPQHAPGTVVHVAVDGDYAGYIVISDEIKAGAADAIAQLRSEGVTSAVMLTGDAEPVARQAAEALRLDDFHASLLPEDKVHRVEALLKSKAAGSALAFVGDGINDAPVLAIADVGIAMGAMGADAAIEAADVVLMDDNPAKVATAIRAARCTLTIVKQNIAFALGVKLIVMALGAVGIANMWAAVFADVGVSVLAILNAMRALNAARSGAPSESFS